MTTLREAAQMALPCPFCGGKDISTREGSSFRWHVAECMTCGAQGSEVRRQTLGQGTTDLWIKQAAADAIAEWNIRAALAQPEQEPQGGYRWREGDVPPSITYTAPPQREYTAWNIKQNRPPLSSDNPTDVVAIAQREWQGLTPEDKRIAGIPLHTNQISISDAFDVIERILREKNHDI